LKAVALHGTKHSTQDTGELLKEKLSERGFDLDPQDFHIQKDENKTVTIKITYPDKINFLGMILKELDFTLEVTERESAELF